MSVGNTLSGHIILAERLNYEERTRYLVVVQANVSQLKTPLSVWDIQLLVFFPVIRLGPGVARSHSILHAFNFMLNESYYLYSLA